MNSLQRMLAPVTMPKMLRIRQLFDDAKIDDPYAAVREILAACPACASLKPGMKLALTVGSRGMASLPELVRGIVDALREKGTEPFIIPAMGSHGGATAEGQVEMLGQLGVTEQSCGCAIRSGMEVVTVGSLFDGRPVYMDKFAFEADGVVIFNRIKPHNAFRSTHESGLLKMAAIGLGKHMGAESAHMPGFGQMGRTIADTGEMLVKTGKIVLAVGSIENAYDKVSRIVACGPENMVGVDAEGLERAKANMPRLCVRNLDLLIVDAMGKEFSGGGIDGNITGRFSTPYITGGATVDKLVVLDLTEKSHGNASGIGLADVVPRSLVEKMDANATYINNITAKNTVAGKIPLTMDTEENAIRCALKTSTASDYPNSRVMRIPNTLHLRDVFISESLLPELVGRKDVEILGQPESMRFDAAGKLISPY